MSQSNGAQLQDEDDPFTILAVLQETQNTLNQFLQEIADKAVEKCENKQPKEMEKADGAVEVEHNFDSSKDFDLQGEVQQPTNNLQISSQPNLDPSSNTLCIPSPNSTNDLGPTVSTIEREILLRGESSPSENRKTPALQLPLEVIPNSPSYVEREIVGDDVGKNRTYIACECDLASVAGGAVPVVESFVASKPSSILALQQSLHETISVIKDCETSKERPCQLRFEDQEKWQRHKKLLNDFSKNISKLASSANNLGELDNLDDQTEAIENLSQYLSELRRLTNELKHNETNEQSSTSTSKSKTKESKIYIKFLPGKSGTKKRRSCNAEVQASSVPTESRTIEAVDSMDGVFIPSTEEPNKMEEDDEELEDGLDITITFPEFEQTLMHKADSHLSVSFSELSAEALCKLKRCPKEFTLRMDFVQGKMFFQSGKSPANNFSIGPDLKITECVLDNKMSDIISIKPSTECVYTSQIIPVEGAKPKNSIKTLKSTDSELFSVVSLPFINRRVSIATRSCITFKNERSDSGDYLIPEKQCNKSMPQIPSLTNILEEPDMELTSTCTTYRTTINPERKFIRNRAIQRKETKSSLDYLLHSSRLQI